MGSELRVERSSTARNQRRIESRGRQSCRGRPPPRADGGRRGEPVRPNPGTAPQSNGQRFHLRPGGVEVWRAGSRGRGEHFGLLHNGRNVAQHRAHGARARGPHAAPGFSVKPPARPVNRGLARTHKSGRTGVSGGAVGSRGTSFLILKQSAKEGAPPRGPSALVSKYDLR